jgi:hypothetical protein
MRSPGDASTSASGSSSDANSDVDIEVDDDDEHSSGMLSSAHSESDMATATTPEGDGSASTGSVSESVQQVIVQDRFVHKDAVTGEVINTGVRNKTVVLPGDHGAWAPLFENALRLAATPLCSSCAGPVLQR